MGLWSGCSGIGLERWASAFYAKEGWTRISGLRLSGRLLGSCLRGLGFCEGVISVTSHNYLNTKNKNKIYGRW